MIARITSLCLLFSAAPALADFQVRFNESAPKDSFTVTRLGTCGTDTFEMTVDMSESAGKLVFDTTATGAGVEVFQPFQTVSGQIALVSGTDVQDGDTSLTVMIKDLPADQFARFTIDVDDTLVQSELGQIRVSGSEITGATVTIAHDDQQITGTFDTRGLAMLKSPDCLG
jgi:hypothetical protein